MQVRCVWVGIILLHHSDKESEMIIAGAPVAKIHRIFFAIDKVKNNLIFWIGAVYIFTINNAF